MDARAQRGLLLYQQGRCDLAEIELRAALAEDVDNAGAHRLLALCLADRQRYHEATAEADESLRLEPDSPLSHYVAAFVYLQRQRLDEAHAAVERAIELDPYDADSFALLASIWISRRQWSRALEAAERGLAIDAAHVSCTNVRAMALVNLGRRDDAGRTIDAALARDPQNSLTHANRGWALLHEGQHVPAMEHFRESLRLDPNQEWARSGIVEALKARHIIYRWMLKYFVAYRLLRSIARTYDELSVWIQPVLIAYAVFVAMTWLSAPLFNLLLRLNRFGRLVLSHEQRVASNWTGGVIALALACAALALITRQQTFVIAAIVCGSMSLPTAGVFLCARGWPRWTMLALTLAVAMIGVLLVLDTARAQFSRTGHLTTGASPTSSSLLLMFLVGIFGLSIAINAVSGRHVKN
jgi:tetratricopeptide (TPR) repeat protein